MIKNSDNGKNSKDREVKKMTENKISTAEKLCQAKCRNGEDCLNHAFPDSKYCWLHKKRLEKDKH